MKYFDIFNFKGVSESWKVAWGPKNHTLQLKGWNQAIVLTLEQLNLVNYYRYIIQDLPIIKPA